MKRFKKERLVELVEQIREHNTLEPADTELCLLCGDGLEGRSEQLCLVCWEILLDELGKDFASDERA